MKNEDLKKKFGISDDGVIQKENFELLLEDVNKNEITKEERQRLVHLIKDFTMTLTGLRSYNEAIITKGGVSVKEIDPGTMESKKMKGLYFAGEVLDLDAMTGGYNLQIAWSTGYLAGINAGCD